MKKTILAISAIALLFTLNMAFAKDQPNGGPFQALWEAVESLQTQINELVLAPGPQGEQGEPGLDGQNGEDGADGLNCWDLDGDGAKDPEEDINGDNFWNAEDCKGEKGDHGEPGADGADGVNCWDLNGNRVCDLATEDLNDDFLCNVLDCKGPQGEQGEPAPAVGVIGYSYVTNMEPNIFTGGEFEGEYLDIPQRTLTYEKKESESILKITYEDNFGIKFNSYNGVCVWRLLLDGEEVGGQKWFEVNYDKGRQGQRERTAQSISWLLPDVSVGEHTIQIQVTRSGYNVSACENGWSDDGVVHGNYLMLEEIR